MALIDHKGTGWWGGVGDVGFFSPAITAPAPKPPEPVTYTEGQPSSLFEGKWVQYGLIGLIGFLFYKRYIARRANPSRRRRRRR